jgi:hypothetical protein
LAIAGCRSDPAVSILERELRLKEDEIYRLRAQLDDVQDCSSSYAANPSGGSQSTSSGSSERRSSANQRPENIPGAPPVNIDLGSPGSSAAPKGFDPGAKPPTDAVPGRKDDRTAPSPDQSSGPSLEQDNDPLTSRPARTTLTSQSSSAVPFTPSGDSRRVASIILNRFLTGGIGDQTSSSDQGLLVVVEPRDRQGRTVDAPAEMSVVVIDPAIEGDAARVARWDFTPTETAALFRRSGTSQAIHLLMVWPSDPPKHNNLHLFVRYVTADGRKLQADQPIDIASPSDQTAQSPGQASQEDAPHIAERPEPPKPHRPAWSPDRP